MRALFKTCFVLFSRNQVTFLQFYFSNIIILTFFIYEPNFLEKFLRENGFPFLAGKLMSRNLKWFIGRHFETVRPIFDFFCFVLFCLFAVFVCLFVFKVL